MADDREEKAMRPNPVRILIAEDNPLTAQLLQEFLSSRPGLEVVQIASNGREAVELSGRLQPHLVLMDVEMPEMNGLEATRRLRARQRGTRVIIVSVHDTHEVRRAARESGAEAFVSKARLVHELFPAIDSLWGGQEPAWGEKL